MDSAIIVAFLWGAVVGVLAALLLMWFIDWYLSRK